MTLFKFAASYKLHDPLTRLCFGWDNAFFDAASGALEPEGGGDKVRKVGAYH